jgi:uncharacterized protein
MSILITRSKFKFRALKLCLIAILVFLAQTAIPGFTELFVLNKSSFQEPWRFLTAIFLHASLAHLILNLFALALFGSILERFVGGRRFSIVFFTTGILANLVAVNFYDSSLGASGAIFGILGALIFIRPLMTVWAFGLPMPMFIAGIIWIAADILGAYGFFTGNPIDNTGNIAHLSGIFFGLIFGMLFREKIRRQKKRNVSIDEREIRLWEDKYLR